MHILCTYTDQKLAQQGQRNSTSVFTALTTFRISVTVWLPSLIYKREESLSDKSGSDQLKEISSHYHDYEHHLSTLQHLFPGVSDGDID